MKTNTNQENSTPYDFEGKLPLKQAIPLGLQHVLAMFVGNLTPILIITSACAAMSDAEQFAAIQVSLLQNAMLIAGVVTLIQLFAIGPVGGKVPIIIGTFPPTGPIVCDWTSRWKGSIYYGNKFWFYWGFSKCCESHGWRYLRICCYYGSIYHWWLI